MERRRRLDRILAPGYADDLPSRSVNELRAMRDECEEEESGISFARRVLQGKLDILRAEVARRQAHDPAADLQGLLDSLPRILAGEVPAQPLRARVTRFLVPPAVQYHRRDVERVMSDEILPTLGERSSDELAELARVLEAKERELSTLRRRLLDIIDGLQDEIAARYRDGRASVDEVLPRGRP